MTASHLRQDISAGYNSAAIVIMLTLA
ncbi:protein of unknown function [Aminobacter niigataensis]|nr:protein of unknown function [Aminobacter niigataensis]